MHGDDVASAGTQIVGETAKGTVSTIFQILMEMWKNRQEQKRLNKELELKNGIELFGEQKTLNELKKGGELVSVPLAREDYEAFKRANKDTQIPYTAIPIENSDTLDVYILKSDESIFKNTLDKLVAEKLSNPDQNYKMTMLDKDKTEAFQNYCAEKNIPMIALDTESGQVKCIYKAENEMKIQKAMEHIDNTKNELNSLSVDIVTNKNKPQFVVNDTAQNKAIRFNFGEKERFEKAIKDNLGYSQEKANLASQALMLKMTKEQKKAFTSGSKLLEQTEKIERNIKLKGDSLLVTDFEFSKIKTKNNPEVLAITDKNGNLAVISESLKDRSKVEDILKQNFGLTNNEQINDMLKKTERLGYVNSAQSISMGEYQIKRTTKERAEITFDNKLLTINLSDRKSAKSMLVNEFGMSENKADRIIDKAKKQSATKSLLNKAKASLPDTKPMIKDKKHNIGTRK